VHHIPRRTAHVWRAELSVPLEADLLVVDETSMVDVPLMASLLAAIAPPMPPCF
jgi:exodeoxyribonuclease V alpha subunit